MNDRGPTYPSEADNKKILPRALTEAERVAHPLCLCSSSCARGVQAPAKSSKTWTSVAIGGRGHIVFELAPASGDFRLSA